MTTADECLPPGLHEFYEYARAVKTSHVINWAADAGNGDTDPDGEPDMAPAIHVTYEDIKTSVICIVPGVDRDLALHAANLLIVGTNPLALTLMADAKIAIGLTNPDTGQEWERGEISSRPEAQDVLIFHTHWRNGRSRGVTSPYAYDKRGGVITWDEDMVIDSGDDTASSIEGGYIPEALTSMYASEAFIEAREYMVTAGTALGLTPEVQLAHQVSAAITHLKQRGLMVLCMTDDQYMQGVLERSHPDSVPLD